MPRLHLHRSRFSSRSKRHKPRWPGVAGWSAGVVAGFALLAGLATLHGNPPEAGGGFPDPALATLAKPAVAALVSFGVLVVIAWCVRHLRFEFLAWWPGRIIVQNFVTNGGTSAPDVERLTASFRDRLGMSHLQSPATVPAPAQQGDFLDVLGRGGVDSGNLLGSLLSLARAAFPAYAYEVSGALVTGEGARPFGVTVHVVRHPGKGSGGHTVWDTSWEGAVRQAADHATAAILPRTRTCRSPWVAWRRYYMPPALLQHYEHAAECEHDRRYDEALDSYYRALNLDPMNHGLRLQIGFLQEKLGLYIDALDTYESMLKVAEPSDRRDTLRRRARHDRDRTLLVARYRHAVLLGGPGLPHQWRKRALGPPTKRDEERERLRERLDPALTKLFYDSLDSREVEKTADPLYAEAELPWPRRRDIEDALRSDEPPAGEQDPLAELFLFASLQRLADLRRLIPRGPRRRRPPLSRAAVRVSSLVVRERLRLQLDRPRCEPRIGWMPYIQKITAEVAAIEPASGFDRWQEHYNVACIWSLPLLTTCRGLERTDIQELADLAVKRLEQATERGDTEFLVSRRDWLVSEDPDLQGLRIQPRFKSFEAAYFPSPSRTPQRPREVHTWEVSRYTLDLLRGAAQRWEETWERRSRALGTGTDTRVLARWSDDELTARRLVRDVAVHHRDWRTRFELLERMHRWSVEYRFQRLEVAFPGFSGVGSDYDDVERATLKAIADKDRRLRRVVRELEDVERRGIGWHGREDSLPRTDVAALCGLHADLWRRIREEVTPVSEPEQAAGGSALERFPQPFQVPLHVAADHGSEQR